MKRRAWWATTLDLSYTASEDLVADVFYTYDNQRHFSAGDAYGTNSTASFQGQAGNNLTQGCFPTLAARNASAKIDPCLNWVHNDRDKIDTAGFTLRRKNLAAKKLDLASEVVYTRARTRNAVVRGSYVNNPLALSSDWRYQALQYGTKPNYLPTSEKAPSYEVHVAGLSLNWAF